VANAANNLSFIIGYKMTVQKPRTRMISVRLSEEEYVALMHLCTVTGARSVSDLTRDSMRALLNSANRESEFGMHLDEFRAEIRNLNKRIEQLTAKLSTALSTAKTGNINE
jgi:Arc/MetJ-type ribon-helix-helix transcriptional regulator